MDRMGGMVARTAACRVAVDGATGHPDRFVGADSLKTLNGARITPSVVGGTAYVDDAPILAVDIQTSNGIIHVIGGVLLP